MEISEDSAGRIIHEVIGATLGDPRRNRRAARVVEKMVRDPSLSLPRLLGNDAEVQGCYRLMNNQEVTFEALHGAHAAGTRERAIATGRVLVLHDTTACTFKHLDPEELGYLQTGQAGFHLHFGLVLAADAWKRPLGVIHAEAGRRTQKPRANRSKQRKKKRKSGTDTARQAHKEFDRWWRGILSSQESLEGVEAVHIADRESDSYELMAQAIGHGVKFIFRSRTDRRGRRADTAASLWSTVREVARGCEGALEREVPLSRRRGDGPPAQAKAHPPRKMRLAKLRFAATRVVIPRPQYLADPVPRSLELSLVHVVEVDPPTGEPPVEWLLYTTEAIDSAAQIAQVVDFYRARWTIEEFNAALKTGCAYEAREFESRHALLNMLALSLPIACEILWLRSRARSTPDAPASEVLSSVQIDVLRHFSSYKLPPAPTANDALLAVAALGGHLRRNGPPGWKVLLGGMALLQAHAAGWEAALAHARRRCDL
jgi:Transposase DNA-binding/Transposase DDE domain